ncbi:hypothetical protein PMALA_041000 [Plasmodium malariae]|uniref:Uncharacterized protein n=1 Tax=Plasmodium malariae TaxID=5858 RepID=A0A1A8WPN2_PLAMA|nr:hypothetical protein PMALA_041000 [Plasmodium malariae]
MEDRYKKQNNRGQKENLYNTWEINDIIMKESYAHVVFKQKINDNNNNIDNIDNIDNTDNIDNIDNTDNTDNKIIRKKDFHFL